MNAGQCDWIHTGDREQLGAAGEDLARRHLERSGWTIEAQNVRFRHGELDLVACQELACGELLVAFIEVKSRRRCDRYSPALAVGFRKRRTIARLAQEYIRARGRRQARYRFDVITVDYSSRPASLQHIQGAFDASGNTC
ncbi:YraN family protein [Lujinxingia litoralis]|uniref:UPF0102 protein DL240_08485 n=1 Tax=Lujinxingia litoralis TaxID=2211119 RepID=A0A328C5Y8_9DELT|nr:YraN family protein [Lujinxingia litoralis]RAL22919.1 YraN family protein [Lujinxingia litoralis]